MSWIDIKKERVVVTKCQSLVFFIKTCSWLLFVRLVTPDLSVWGHSPIDQLYRGSALCWWACVRTPCLCRSDVRRQAPLVALLIWIREADHRSQEQQSASPPAAEWSLMHQESLPITNQEIKYLPETCYLDGGILNRLAEHVSSNK